MKRFSLIAAVMVVGVLSPLAVAKMAMVSDADCVKQSEVILVGKVKEVATMKKMPPEYVVTIEVSKVLKGKADKEVTLQFPGIARNTPPTAGDEKIFLLNPKEGGGYVMGVGATMFSVRDAGDREKFEKLIEAEKK